MDSFRPVTMKWWQVTIFKFTMLAFGIAIGAYWSDIFDPYLTWLVGLGVLGAFYLISVRARK